LEEIPQGFPKPTPQTVVHDHGGHTSMASSRPHRARKGPPSTAKTSWNPSSFPYPVDYNDHFETPLQAYRDIQPMIDWLFSCDGDCVTDCIDDASKSDHRISTPPVLYDPYYCNGKSKVLLESLGYENVVHERRDFYEDIRLNRVPRHDVFVTNPPYSDDHKIKCLEYCCSKLVGSASDHPTKRTVPFFVLVPAYVASKAYYRSCLLKYGLLGKGGRCGTDSGDGGGVVYLVPNRTVSGGSNSNSNQQGKDAYQYEHPEGTGHEVSPFASLWICGIGTERARVVRNWWQTHSARERQRKDDLSSFPSTATLYCSLDELEEAGVISTERRPNPKQRRRKRNQLVMACEPAGAPAPEKGATTDSLPANKKSKYRDESGKRSRKRF
jgi:hypothetical protein